ncbi:MAG TPA: ABC transporter ATP-binding protein [candidate division WOR-3 bacterium]|uniref:ABC transporter ATP-binding protein n=1 Tax=candidate division WOR-3 bacterium TaxID=2052148 RepID=A0A7V5HPZ8_UNCW3|nr:ABC transporter ATP-binding protein [candidate division WOR-3 bacterium]
MNKAIVANGIWKSYKTEVEVIEVIKGLDLEVNVGERVIIMGPSGSGKSTLLHLLGTIDIPDKGELYILDLKVNGAKDDELSRFRARHIGFVFQFHHLFSDFTALQNVMIPLILNRFSAREAEERAYEVLKEVGLEGKEYKRPQELSGGEQQRVAIARALATRPSLLLLDEPTGNLDAKNALKLMELIEKVSREKEITTIMVSHNQSLSTYFDTAYLLDNGRLKRYEP